MLSGHSVSQRASAHAMAHIVHSPQNLCMRVRIRHVVTGGCSVAAETSSYFAQKRILHSVVQTPAPKLWLEQAAPTTADKFADVEQR